MKKTILILCAITLVCVLILAVGCNKNVDCTVTFDKCTDLRTNTISDVVVAKGSTIFEPTVVFISGAKMELVGWFTDKSYTTKWDFETDTVQGDMTLYAKWQEQLLVTYYMGTNAQNVEKIYEEYILENQYLPEHEDLYDGYDFVGWYLDENFTIPFDYNELRVTENISLYLKRSEILHFTPEALNRRFEFVPSDTYAQQLESGRISLVKQDDESYAKIDFGKYDGESDAHIYTTFPKFDITKTQRFKITLKNLGYADRLVIYWAGINADGSYVNDTPNCNETQKISIKLPQKNMSETDEWITIEVDLAQSPIMYGVSLWGAAAKTERLRLQAVVAQDDYGKENVVLIKSIQGVYDATYTNPEDSDIVKDMLHDDSEEALSLAADSQENLSKGFVFPKDNECITDGEGIYKTTNGILMYGSYLSGTVTCVLDCSDKNIDLSANKLFKFRYENYGYVTNVHFKFITNSGIYAEADISVLPQVSQRSAGISMHDDFTFRGILEKVEITFQTVGIDNAFVLKGFDFTEFTGESVLGFNFFDTKTGGFVETEDIKLKSDSLGGVQFIVNKDNSCISKQTPKFALDGYSDIVLRYALKESSDISKVTVTLVTAENNYQTTFSLTPNGTYYSDICLPIAATGEVTSISLNFEGTGTVCIASVTFALPQTAIDLSQASLYQSFNSEWKNDGYYDELAKAFAFVDAASQWDYYLGYIHIVGSGGNFGPYPSFELANKSKIVVIYQNQGKSNTLGMQVGISDISTPDDPAEGSKRKVLDSVEIQTEMGEGEWCCAIFDLSTLSEYLVADSTGTLAAIHLYFEGGPILFKCIMLV